MANKGSITYYHYEAAAGDCFSKLEYSSNCIAQTTFSWEVIQDVVYNQSTVNWTIDMMAYGYNGTQYLPAGSSVYVKENTKADYSGMTTTLNSIYLDTRPILEVDKPVRLASGSFTVDHKTNGTRNLYLIYSNDYIGDAYKLVDGEKVITESFYDYAGIDCYLEIPLNTISRHGMVYTHNNFGDFTDEDSPMIKYAVPSGVTGEIYMTLDGNVKTQSTHIMQVTGAGTKAYTFTQADLDAIWDIQDEGLRHKGIKFVIRSVSPVDGETYWESINATLYLKNYDPELHIEVYDDNQDVINRLTGNRDILIRNLSKAKCITGAKAVKGSTINTQSVKNAGISKYGATVYFDAVQGNEFEFAVVDNHGNSNKETKVFSVETGKFIKYTKPTANVSVTELTGDGKVAITVYGKYYKGGFGPSVNNKLRISWSLLKHNEPYDSGVFEDVYVTTDSEDNFSYTFQRTGLEYLDVYELTVGVSDVAVPTEVYAEAIIAAVPVFDWGRQDFAFNVPVTIQGASVPSIVEQGTNYTGWTYRKWSDGTAECWYSKKVSAKINTATGNGYGSGAVSGSNVSFPITFIAIPTILVSLTPTGTTTPAYLTPSSTAATTEQTGTYQLNSMSSDSTTRNYIINYEVRGKWK
jgi:hypothetical protein